MERQPGGLIFYVRAKKITDVVESAEATLQGRLEFTTWEPTAHEGELRCRVRWPEDEDHEATLTALFVHLPRRLIAPVARRSVRGSIEYGRWMAERKVARLHLRSTVKGVDHVAIENWCLCDGEGGDGWAGVGWGLWNASRNGIGWEEYQRAREESDGMSDSVERLHDLPVGSLVWTRRRDSSYWLGEITGEWEYRDGDHAQQLDMFNVRPCTWWKVGEQDSVPGVIVGNFNQRITLNPVANAAAIGYTRRLHAQLSGNGEQVGPSDLYEVVEALLGALDLEDLVAAYLQDCHDFVLVNRGRSTVGYEYVLRHRMTGAHAVATVKAGGAVVDLDALPTDADVEVWVYAVSGETTGQPREDVRWIETKQLVDFISERQAVLPDQVVRWLT